MEYLLWQVLWSDVQQHFFYNQRIIEDLNFNEIIDDFLLEILIKNFNKK